MGYKKIKSLRSEMIHGKKVEFERRKASSYDPGKYAGQEYVQAYVDNRPFASGKTKAEAVDMVRRNMRLEKRMRGDR